MWQTIEYKAAAIEQFRKGDLLQRVIDDVQSEAATAAEMKAAASGNPLILMQVQLAADLHKLEALHTQHQRTQHRLRDRLKHLQGAEERLDAARKLHEDALALRDAHTRYDVEKGEKKIHQELFVDGRPLDAKDDKKKIQERFKTQINQLPLGILGKGFPVGTYRGFEIEVLKQRSDDKVFQFSLKGAGAVRYPANLRYVFGEEFSLSGFFQRVDNYLDKRLDQVWEEAQTLAQQELVERSTVEAKIGEGFAQEDELELVRRNHDAVIGELKRMQDDKEYVSEWAPMMLEDLRAERESLRHGLFRRGTGGYGSSAFRRAHGCTGAAGFVRFRHVQRPARAGLLQLLVPTRVAGEGRKNKEKGRQVAALFAVFRDGSEAQPAEALGHDGYKSKTNSNLPLEKAKLRRPDFSLYLFYFRL